MAGTKFVTDLCLVAQQEQSSMVEWKVLETNTFGQDGNLWESTWRSKGKRNLAYKSDDADEYVVTDIQILPDDKVMDSSRFLRVIRFQGHVCS